MQREGKYSGISLAYLLCNLISATEQFTLGFTLIIFDTNAVATGPRSAGDWLNLCQFTLVWVLLLFL
jgi:hypothetical protein